MNHHLETQNWSMPVTGPAAKLSVSVFEPRNYHLKYDLKIEPDPKKPNTMKLGFEMKWNLEKQADDTEVPYAGTVIVLHGIYAAKEAMLHWALYLAERGYRCVLVDLRGHGESTGDRITYGAIETHDLKLLLDELQRRGLAGDHVGVLGISYGASIGLMLAAQDDRVATVVGLQPFADAREAVPEFVRASFPKIAAKLSEDDFSQALIRAEKLGSFSWTTVDVRQAVKELKVPILLFHGAKDNWLNPRHSCELIALAAKDSRLVILPEDNHITLSFRLDPVAQEVAAWLRDHLTGSRVNEPSEE